MIFQELAFILQSYYRLAFDKDAQISKALELIKLYAEEGVKKDKVLIKIPASWEGIQAAK